MECLSRIGRTGTRNFRVPRPYTRLPLLFEMVNRQGPFVLCRSNHDWSTHWMGTDQPELTTLVDLTQHLPRTVSDLSIEI